MADIYYDLMLLLGLDLSYVLLIFLPSHLIPVSILVFIQIVLCCVFSQGWRVADDKQ